ncbi:LysR family transcriptional regulator [Ramlibacter sp. WS9]|uniref:LysR family transcriptional regulator n=1 Tax=Ramlibacter sp. WS9 TaxID=1882741 RepID=UPI0011436CA5|nr:LysR family transcriptional regulator [Ramlibacter sp. WS9]ROZ78037.1 LysR family transcriptional regulator [Ramlibacter sp. WS9]
MINFRLMRHLWLFLVVAEEQHFGRAAKRLGMSQPPVTEQIQILEASLKVKLFERSSRGTQLTAAGAAILPVVRKLVEHMQQLELAVREAAAGQIGVLTIGAISSSMLDVLPPVIDGFRKSHPGVTVAVKEIDSVDAVSSLRTGEIDLALARLQVIGDDEIATEPLKEDRLAVAMPKDHPSAGLPRIRLATLAAENFIMFAREVSPDYFDSLTAACRANDFTPRIVHLVRSVASQVAFVGCGQGVALVPASMRKLAAENVVIKPLKENVKVITAAVAWNRKRPNVLVDEFKEALLGRSAVARKAARAAEA